LCDTSALVTTRILPALTTPAQVDSATLDQAAAVASVGSKGDSFDNAMAEALNSLYKAELIFLDGPWTGREDVEAATAQWVHWFNTERVHGMLDYRTPAEVQPAYYAQPPAASAA
jgi:putative transposase